MRNVRGFRRTATRWLGHVIQTGIVCALVSGCISVEGPQLTATPNFVPKKSYDVPYDQAWDKVISVLKRERIILVSTDKPNGIIVTDYIPGPTIDAAALFTATYRYKYNIAFEKTSPSQTHIDVGCKLELRRMNKGGSAREAVEQLKGYEDVTHKEKKNAENYEKWLYERIEKSL